MAEFNRVYLVCIFYRYVKCTSRQRLQAAVLFSRFCLYSERCLLVACACGMPVQRTKVDHVSFLHSPPKLIGYHSNVESVGAITKRMSYY